MQSQLYLKQALPAFAEFFSSSEQNYNNNSMDALEKRQGTALPYNFPSGDRLFPNTSQTYDSIYDYENNYWKIDLMKPLIHEAAHAVIARRNGFHVDWLSVDPSFIKADATAIRSGCNYGNALCMTRSSLRIDAFLKRRTTANKQFREIIIEYCMHVLAGPHAEYCLDPSSFDPNYGENDYLQAASIIAKYVKRKEDRKSIQEKSIRRMKKSVMENWQEIVLVAAKLCQDKTVFLHDLDTLINSRNHQEANLKFS